MNLLHLVVLALVQGITEFLPISSSGHLVLVHRFLGDEAAGSRANLLMDVAVHVGTLCAVLIYFRRDVLDILCGAWRTLKNRETGDPGARLGLYVLAASVPVIIAGYCMHAYGVDWSRSLSVLAWMTLIFGIVLWWADERFPDQKTLTDMTLAQAMLIGLAQVVALVPGTSRSGITMTAARLLGYKRTVAAHFSLLLAIVSITGAGTLAGVELYESGDAAFGLEALIAAVLAFGSALLVIRLMMRWLETATFRIFAIYRVILGVVLLTAIYSGWLSA